MGEVALCFETGMAKRKSGSATQKTRQVIVAIFTDNHVKKKKKKSDFYFILEYCQIVMFKQFVYDLHV